LSQFWYGEHPSKDIKGSSGEELKDRKIVLCVCGSVAAVDAPRLARELMRHGAEVFPVISEWGQRIIHPYLLEWATGNPVVTELTGRIEHIRLAGDHPQRTDLVLVAPATANTIGKIANGIDDTPVTSVATAALGSGTPLIIVPAMHESMYRHPAVAENLARLKEMGVTVLEPKVEEGKAKIADIAVILETVIAAITKKDMAGLRVLITAGPTYEYIDPVRVISNKSSGKMGIALAREAYRRGAEVTLVYGHGTAQPPSRGVRVVRVDTTEDLYRAVTSELDSWPYDIFIGAAAAVDYAPERSFESKVRTESAPELFIKLKASPKVVNEVKKISPRTFTVAFKAETNLSDAQLVERAYARLVNSDIDLIVANDVSREGVGFQVDTNEVFIVDRAKEAIHVPLRSKSAIAREILDEVMKRIKRSG
jgi:phosphopantothenoylcysteine decarboxylase/phosphopantothenate--cysteine ligase